MTNPIGVYYAYYVKNWESEVMPLMKRTKNLDLDVMEANALLLADMSREECESWRKKKENLDLKLNYCLGLDEETNIAADNERVRRDGIEFMKKTIEKAALTGGGKISGLIHGTWNIDYTELSRDKEFYWEKSLKSMREIVKTAADYNVILNVESVNRFEQFLINTSQEAVDYVSEIDHPNLKVHLDTFHMNIEEDSFKDAILIAGDWLGNFHIGENNRRPPGEGEMIDWEEIFTALKEANYGGEVVMEPFIIPGGTVADDVALWRDLGPADDNSLDQRLKAAKEFVEDWLK